MGIKIEIEGADMSAIQKHMQGLLPPSKGLDEMTLQEVLAYVEKRAAAEGAEFDIVPAEKRSPAEQRKAEARAKLRGQLEESVELGIKETKETAKETAPPREETVETAPVKKAKKTSSNGKGESDEERKARCIERIKDLFGDHKKEIMEILAKHGDGIKNFSMIPADRFGPISDALALVEV